MGDVVSKGRDMKYLGTGKSIERHRSLERDWAVFMKCTTKLRFIGTGIKKNKRH
jgi:hypothetical protein